jgi:hypothetical protein
MFHSWLAEVVNAVRVSTATYKLLDPVSACARIAGCVVTLVSMEVDFEHVLDPEAVAIAGIVKYPISLASSAYNSIQEPLSAATVTVDALKKCILGTITVPLADVVKAMSII